MGSKETTDSNGVEIKSEEIHSEHLRIPQADAALMKNHNQSTTAIPAGNALLPPFQQPGASLQLGGAGVIGVQPLQPNFLNGQISFTPFMSGLVPQGNIAGNFHTSYLQQLLAAQGTNQRLGYAPNVSVSQFNPMAIPSTTPNSMSGATNSQGQNASSGQVRGGPPSAIQVQNALATLAAATYGAAVPSLPSVNIPPNVEDGGASNESSFIPVEGHPPIIIYMDMDEESLSDYQCLLRKQIELFEATSDDVQWNAQGRNKAIVLGQVGIRCRYCARSAAWARARGAVYYSATLDGLYQAAQNMAKNHLSKHCCLIPQDVRNELLGLRDSKRRAAGGKNYWTGGARVLGVYQTSDGLRFKDSTVGKGR